MSAILARLKQPSTYAGLMGAAMLLGVSADGFEQWSNAAAGLFAFLAIVLNEGA